MRCAIQKAIFFLLFAALFTASAQEAVMDSEHFIIPATANIISSNLVALPEPRTIPGVISTTLVRSVVDALADSANLRAAIFGGLRAKLVQAFIESDVAAANAADAIQAAAQVKSLMLREGVAQMQQMQQP